MLGRLEACEKPSGPRVRRRFAREARDLSTVYPAIVAAARRHYRGNPLLRAKMDAILADLHPSSVSHDTVFHPFMLYTPLPAPRWQASRPKGG